MTLHLVLAGESSGEKAAATPLIPKDIGRLSNEFLLKVSVEPSSCRVYGDHEYNQVGLTSSGSSGEETWVLGVNQVDPEAVVAGRWYFLSSLGLKGGWAGEMPLLNRLQSLGCTLIDMELVLDAEKKERVSWAHFSGITAMAESLYVLGTKLRLSGIDNILSQLKAPSLYLSSVELLNHLEMVGDRLSEDGLPEQAYPVIVSILGGGRFDDGINEVLRRFPLKTFSSYIVDENIETFSGDPFSLYKVGFMEADLFTSSESMFDMTHFLANPGLYQGNSGRFLPFSTVVINSAFWTLKHPKLLTREYLKTESYLHSNPMPKVVADLIGRRGGPLEIFDETDICLGCYQTYHGRQDRFIEGINASGSTLLSCQNGRDLFPKEASADYSTRFSGILADLISARSQKGGRDEWIPVWLRKAMVVDNGVLFPDRY